MFVLGLILLGVFSTTWTLECGNDASCQALVDAKLSSQDVLKDTFQSLVDGTNEFSEAASALLKETIIHLGDHTTIRIVGNLTRWEAKSMLEMVAQQLNILKKLGLIDDAVMEKAMEEAREAIEGLVRHGSNVYGITADVEEVKAEIRKVVKDVNNVLRKIILKVLDDTETKFDRIVSIIGDLMKKLGLGEKWQKAVEKYEKILKKVREQVAKKATGKVEDATLVCVSALEDYFGSVVTESGEAYGFKDVWRKIKSGVKSIGSHLGETAEKIYKHYQDKLEKSGKKIGKVAADALGKILTDIVNDLAAKLAKQLE